MKDKDEEIKNVRKQMQEDAARQSAEMREELKMYLEIFTKQMENNQNMQMKAQ